MDYAKIVESIVQITKRGERLPQIQLAIAKATLRAHLSDFFNRDIVEVKALWSQNLAPRYEIDARTLLPRMRKIAYLNGYDDTTDPLHPRVMQNFEENLPSSIRDIYGNRKQNTFYLAGETITCWASWEQPPKFLCGYWITPQVDPENYRSWIADMYPQIIIDEASGEISGSVGDNDEAMRRAKMWSGNLQIVRMNDIEATGR